MINPQIFVVHRLRPRHGGVVDSHVTAKFALDDDMNVHHLCDYNGLLRDDVPEGPLTYGSQAAIQALFRASHYSIERRDVTQLREDSQHETTPEARRVDAGNPNGTLVADPTEPSLVSDLGSARPPSIFDYHRVGMDKPHTVEIREGTVHLDGNRLTPDEADLLIQNINNGLATIRYRKVMAPQPTDPRTSLVKKFEHFFFDLAKAEGLADSLVNLRKLVDSGHLHPDHYENIRRELYQDEMVPSIGNKRAYNEFLLNDGRGGVHIMLDANDFKSINDDLSHQHGDQAIKAMGEALRRTVDTHIGSENAKVHRFGGDEFHVHVPSQEHAAIFLRQLRSELEAIPPVGGTHKLSMSAGTGVDPTSADLALKEGAKAQKKAAIAALGGDPHSRHGLVRAPHALYAHSYVPGHEGAVPTSDEALPLAQPGEARKLAVEAMKIQAAQPLK